MRETLICIGKIGKTPYSFKETGVRVSSYEEICYYVSRHMICYLYTLPDDDLATYIDEELGLTRLAYLLQKSNNPKTDKIKYFTALFREGNYFSENEVRDILDKYNKLQSMSVIRQYKELGDMFLGHHKTAMAIKCYSNALKYTSDNEEQLGNLWHNMGVAKMRMFRFLEAKKAFINAFRYNGNEESLFSYFVSVALEEGQPAASEAIKKFPEADILLDSFEERYYAILTEFKSTNEAEFIKRLHYVTNHGRSSDAVDMSYRMVKKLQSDFREEQEIDNHLTKMMKQEEHHGDRDEQKL